MPPSESTPEVRTLNRVCLRGHASTLNSSHPIESPEYAEEACQHTCPTCGAFWHYSTDGRNVVYHVHLGSVIPRVPKA